MWKDKSICRARRHVSRRCGAASHRVAADGVTARRGCAAGSSARLLRCASRSSGRYPSLLSSTGYQITISDWCSKLKGCMRCAVANSVRASYCLLMRRAAADTLPPAAAQPSAHRNCRRLRRRPASGSAAGSGTMALHTSGARAQQRCQASGAAPPRNSTGSRWRSRRRARPSWTTRPPRQTARSSRCPSSRSSSRSRWSTCLATRAT